VLDVAGNRSWSACKRVLGHTATLVLVGGLKRWLGPLDHRARARLAAMSGSRKVVLFLAKPKRADVVVLQELLETGKVTPVIGRQCLLRQVPGALSYLG
jgi:NADPH:quinone reductase-like Zn-dependent oxidoreductase